MGMGCMILLSGQALIMMVASNLSGTKDTGSADEDVRILGKAATDFLGLNVSSVGDVNGDGLDDFIIVATGNNDGGSDDEGAAYIFFGATSLSGTKDLGGADSADVTILGKASGDQVGGGNAAGVGDVNGDGFDDIIVGSRFNDDGGNNAGAAYIFFGSSTLSGTKALGGGQSADVTFLGKGSDDQFSVASGAGDVNGDGFDDVIVGAFFNNDGGSNDEGAAYIFFGASDLSGTKALGLGQSADVTILGKAATDRVGFSVSGAGDVNGDGFDDFIVGSRYNDDGVGANNNGAAYIFFGSTSLSGTFDMGGGVQSANVTIFGKAASDFFSERVSGVGDVNGDGYDDILVGAVLNDDGANPNAGAAYIFFGASDLSGTKSLGGVASADMTMLGKAVSDYFGTSVSGVGDVNADGFADILVGAKNNNDGGSNNEGAAYIFFGASDLSGTKDTGSADEDVRILGKGATDQLGMSVGGGRGNPGP